jgi:hypothetical protein
MSIIDMVSTSGLYRGALSMVNALALLLISGRMLDFDLKGDTATGEISTRSPFLVAGIAMVGVGSGLWNETSMGIVEGDDRTVVFDDPGESWMAGIAGTPSSSSSTRSGESTSPCFPIRSKQSWHMRILPG